MTTQKKRIVVKIGSSSLTNERGGLSHTRLQHYVRALAAIKQQGHEVILVSSGAVAAGFRSLGFPHRPDTLEGKQAAAAVGQGLLIQAYAEAFGKFGMITAQVLLTRTDFSDRDRYRNAYNTLSFLLKKGVVPIINENDTVSINELTFGDNDMLSALVAGLLQSDYLIIFTDTDGIYDADPRRNPDAHRIPHIDKITPDIEAMATDSGSQVGTGGMKSKIMAAKTALMLGVPVFIGKSDEDPDLLHILDGRGNGTYLGEDTPSPVKTRKQWIAFHSETHGEIRIDEGAARAILEDGKSLLPAGVTGVTGTFKPGQVVKVVGPGGNVIGKGQINYSHIQLDSVKGLPGYLAKQKSQSDKEEVIHRDDWVALNEIKRGMNLHV
ncbi:MAG: glutamate 5-kinase [Bacillaceae bacterium]|nr:glutamate 5-kinase [Bacillaceae bacterium]